MSDTQFFRKYLDYLDEAPKTPQAVAAQKDIARQDAAADAEFEAGREELNQRAAAYRASGQTPQNTLSATNAATPNTSTAAGLNSIANAIDPNDKNAAAFGKQINPQSAPTDQLNKGLGSYNPKLANINQQVAKASNVVDPNAAKGGGYDPSKVQYAYSGGKPTPAAPAASTTQSASLDAAKAKAIGGNTQPPAQAANPGTAAAGVAFNQGAKSQPAQAAAPEPSLASQYVAASQPKAAPAATTTTAAPTTTASEPSLASQYVQTNQGTGLAEEEHDSDDDLLKSIIRLIKQ